MRVTWAKAASLLLVVVLVASVAGLAGCGGEQTTEKTLVIGFLDDLTGPAGFSVSHTLSSTQDYLKMAEEENQFPGLKVKLINYDTRLDYSRTVPGYVWLKGQGTQLLFMLTSTFVAQVRSSLERDNIPCFASGAIPSTLGSDWIYSYFPAQNYQSEAIVQWIIENWDYTTKGRAPKIGMISQFGYEAGPLVDDWVNTVLKPRYPGKFEYKSVYSSAGQTAFAGEVAQLRDYDFIYPTSIYGPQLAGFLKEAVARGYTGQFIQSGDNWWGFWEVIKGAMALSGLNGAISQSFYPIWTDDIPFITDAKARLLQQHPDEVDFQMAHTFWTSGEYYGMVLAEVIKKAIASVGAANITPTAMRDALADLQLDVTGWGVGTWSYGDTGILQKAFKMYKYNASEDKWYGISSWELPVSFTG